MATEKEIQDLFSDLENGPGLYKEISTSVPTRRRKRRAKDVLLLPLVDEVYMPYTRVGFRVSENIDINTVERAMRERIPLMLISIHNDQLTMDHLPVGDGSEYDVSGFVGRIGVVGMIQNIERNPLRDDEYDVFFVGGYQAIVNKAAADIFDDEDGAPVLYYVADIEEQLCTPIKIESEIEENEYRKALTQAFTTTTQYLNDAERERITNIISELETDHVRYLNFLIQNSPLSSDEMYTLLEEKDLAKRRLMFINYLNMAVYKLAIRQSIFVKTQAQFGDRQREEFLRQQIQNMQAELGEGDFNDMAEMEKRAARKEWSKETNAIFRRELSKMGRFNPSSPEYALQYTYLDTFLKLPWNHIDRAQISLDEVERILDRDHYGLEKVKERIIEQMAVIKLRDDLKSPILCLYGPPGVGKTSLGKSIAEALGRKYVRVALGGIHDESEIRGHRRTYLGSMPGRIISALEKCETNNPVMVLDEIDKIGNDYKGDPSMALLEVLDPEQNKNFHDNYLGTDYDLSKILFIATANDLSTISAPLLDRMELIEIGSYVEEEKLQIAQRHLVPKSLTEHGFERDEIEFTESAIHTIISEYTREAGVRRLEKRIGEVLRKIARLKASDREYPKQIDEVKVREYLGKHTVDHDMYENNDTPGVVTGLAWTAAGGEILFIESSLAPGKGGVPRLTGNLGDVMKESAMIALQYLRANAAKYGIESERFDKTDVHIHVPEGATPKDGPSAGITMLTSLVSSFTGRKVAPRIAMTGEITLRGKVLPVGGIKEKILAAKRAGINTVILSSKNRKDIEEINAGYIDGMTFHYADGAEEVLELALLP